VITRIFESKVYKVPQGWIELQNEELRDLYTSPNIIKVIKLRRMRCVGHVAARMVHRRPSFERWS